MIDVGTPPRHSHNINIWVSRCLLKRFLQTNHDEKYIYTKYLLFKHSWSSG